jgi:hypothetical protein
MTYGNMDVNKILAYVLFVTNSEWVFKNKLLLQSASILLCYKQMEI